MALQLSIQTSLWVASFQSGLIQNKNLSVRKSVIRKMLCWLCTDQGRQSSSLTLLLTRFNNWPWLIMSGLCRIRIWSLSQPLRCTVQVTWGLSLKINHMTKPSGLGSKRNLLWGIQADWCLMYNKFSSRDMEFLSISNLKNTRRNWESFMKLLQSVT